jgi:FHS family glucose/mannose:H+ symporter-like MFS transporter
MTVEATTNRTTQGKLRIAAAFVLFIALGATTASLGAALPFLRDRFGLGPGDVGAVISAYNVGALVAIVGCGVTERFLRPRPTMVVAHAAFVVGCAGMTLAPAWPAMVASSAVAGLGYGGLVLHLNTAFARGFGSRSVLMVNLLNAAFGAGAVLGPVLTSAVTQLGVRLPLLVGLMLATLAWPATQCILLPPPRPVTPGRTGLRTALLAVLPFAAIGFLYAGLETSIGAWESTHLTWTGSAPGTAARLTALFWAALAIGRIVIPAALPRWRPPVLVCAGLMVATAALALTTQPDLAIAGYTIAGLALAPVLPTTLAWMASTTTRAQLANSIVLTSCMLANAIHPAIVGALADATAPSHIPITLTAFAALGLLAALGTARLRRHPPHRTLATPER